MIMSKEIRLGNTGYIALIDDEDFERVSRHSWSITYKTREGKIYAKREYAKGGRSHIIQRLSHFILGLPNNTNAKVQHINSNSLDCRKENLRVCHGACVVINKRSKTRPFRVRLFVKNRQIMLGSYPNREYAEDVARRVVIAKSELLNNPPIRLHIPQIKAKLLDMIEEIL